MDELSDLGGDAFTLPSISNDNVERRPTKMLSVGLNSIVPPAPAPPLTYAQKIELMSRHITDAENRMKQKREQLEYENQPISGSRKPFVRRDMGNEQFTGLVVGDQRDKSKAIQDKRNAQFSYYEQLEADLKVKATKSGDNVQMQSPLRRNRMLKRENNFEEEQLYTGLAIGKDAKAEKEEKKINAMKLHMLTLTDMNNKADGKSLREKKLEKARQESSELGFYIGADESNNDYKRKENQKKYFDLLSKDIADGSPLKQKVMTRPSEINVDNYVEETGWTSIQIGGISSDGTKSQLRLQRDEKLIKQENYRKELLQQQSIASKIANDRFILEQKDLKQTSTLPYMKL